MLRGAPARLRPTTPLRDLAPHAGSRVLGVWLRGSRRPASIVIHQGRLLLAEDLGYLLRRCETVAVRDGEAVAPVPSAVLIGWRVLEIVLAAPYLPEPEQLRSLFPAAQVREGAIVLPLGLGSGEEALALCAARRLPVAGSRISYSPTSVDAIRARSLG
jgi:hypothetical protein